MGYSPQGLKELDSTKVTEDRARYRTFQVGLSGKESACNAGDLDSVPRSRLSPGRGHGNPLQHPCLENPMDRGAWQTTVHRVTKSQTQLK